MVSEHTVQSLSAVRSDRSVERCVYLDDDVIAQATFGGQPVSSAKIFWWPFGRNDVQEGCNAGSAGPLS